MGLAVSQVRLLALTDRKADVELQIQLDSRRKQMLTRKSTDLAQEYYNRLQNSTVQYATNDGYQDVDYNYLMGETEEQGSTYTTAFLNEIIYGNKNTIDKKSDYNMILINQYGQVVANQSIANAVSNSSGTSGTTLDKTAAALLQLINGAALTTTGSQSDAVKSLKNLISNGILTQSLMKAIIESGADSTSSAGIVYESKGTYYQDTSYSKKAELKDGVCYKRMTHNGTNWQAMDGGTTKMYYNGAFIDITETQAAHIYNLKNYFAPIISAAIQNGIALDVTKNLVVGSSMTQYSFYNEGGQTKCKTTRYTDNGADGLQAGTPSNAGSSVDIGGVTIPPAGWVTASWTIGQIQTALGSAQLGDPKQFIITDPSGQSHYFVWNGNALSGYDSTNLTNNFYRYTSSASGQGNFTYAQDNEKLQAGLKSGVFQLAMVNDLSRGSYKKNTTLNYFTNSHYVVDRMDSSEKEKITAWFNAEQAKISEKETYWDTEIQNLSTELTSINTEIDSVKQLKSNAIKSVFNWGGS